MTKNYLSGFSDTTEGAASELNAGLERKGQDALWLWFGMGKASWLTLPRVLMHQMPDQWQAAMADLLEQYEETYPNQPDLGTKVQITDLAGKLVKTPSWLINYRHPDYDRIEILRSNVKVRGCALLRSPSRLTGWAYIARCHRT